MGTPRKISFIGTGIMGSAMAGHLIDAGYELTVYNRTASKCEALAARGARVAADVADAARDADVIITMVGYPEDVEELYLGKGGLLESARPGAYLIDMTTSSPELAWDISVCAQNRDMVAFDAPVTGGQPGAVAATLTIFCGAAPAILEPVMPVLGAMGSRILPFGEAGKGQLAKLANQTALAGAMTGLAEGLAFAKECGLDLHLVLDALLGGTAASASMAALGPRILDDDFKPGFMVEHYIKDLGLILQVAEEKELTLPGVETANQLYGMLDAIGGGKMGTQAVTLVYADEPTCAAHGLDWSVLSGGEDESLEEEHGEGCACGCHDHGYEHGHDHDLDEDDEAYDMPDPEDLADIDYGSWSEFLGFDPDGSR